MSDPDRLGLELAVRLVTALSGPEVPDIKEMADRLLARNETPDGQQTLASVGDRSWWTHVLQDTLARAVAGQDVTDLLDSGANAQ